MSRKSGEDQVQDYLFYLAQERKLAWVTIRTKVYGMKFFYHDFLGRPFSKFYIPSPKVPKRLPTIWSPEEIKALIGAAETLKMQAMIKVAYASGLRAAEVVHLKVEDIDSGHMTLWVRQGKRRKDRAALLSPTLLNDLRSYWQAYRPKTWLFPPLGRPDKPLLPASFGRSFQRIKDRLGFDKPGRTHTLRHSFATHLIASGADIYTVQKLLGHSSMATTAVYIHLAQSIVVARASHLDLLSQRSLLEKAPSEDPQ